MNYYLKTLALVLASGITTAGGIYGTHYVVDYVKERNDIKERLYLLQYNLHNIEEKHRQVINALVKERDALKEKLNSVKTLFEKGRVDIESKIKEIEDMLLTLQGRINLIYKYKKFLQEPLNKISENFRNLTYLASE